MDGAFLWVHSASTWLGLQHVFSSPALRQQSLFDKHNAFHAWRIRPLMKVWLCMYTLVQRLDPLASIQISSLLLAGVFLPPRQIPLLFIPAWHSLRWLLAARSSRSCLFLYRFSFFKNAFRAVQGCSCLVMTCMRSGSEQFRAHSEAVTFMTVCLFVFQKSYHWWVCFKRLYKAPRRHTGSLSGSSFFH